MPTSAELFFHDGAGKIIPRCAKTAAAQRQNIFSSRAPARTYGQKNDGFFRFPAAARGARPRPRQGAAAPPPRRTALQSRRDATVDDADRDKSAAEEARDHDDPGDARPDRSDDNGR